MTDFGYTRIAAVVPRVHLADPMANAMEMGALAREATERGASVILFPELSLTGSTCMDLFSQSSLVEASQRASIELLQATSDLDALIVYGAPVPFRGRLFDAAVSIRAGRVLSIVPGTGFLPSGQGGRSRWFSPASLLSGRVHRLRYAGQDVPFGTGQMLRVGEDLFSIEVGDDLRMAQPPCMRAAAEGAAVTLSLQSLVERIGSYELMRSLAADLSRRLRTAYVMASSGLGESTQDGVFSGGALIIENGRVLSENERFQDGPSIVMTDVDTEMLSRMRQMESPQVPFQDAPLEVIPSGARRTVACPVDLLHPLQAHPMAPEEQPALLAERCREVLEIQIRGLRSRLEHIGCRCGVIGISGGLDSTLALLVTVLAFDRLGLDRKGIIAVTMPGFGTSSRTHGNAVELMQLLGVTAMEISIAEATRLHFRSIGQDESVHDVTYENAQARERTQILMDLANRHGGIVIGTGDLSELALGWCTYNGDHMSSYCVNSGVPKTLVRQVVAWASRTIFSGKDPQRRSVGDILMDIVDTPISPELKPLGQDGDIQQKTEDLVGPYELHDFFLYFHVRMGFSPEKILMLARKAFQGRYEGPVIEKWLRTFLRRFFTQQFKRSCMPDGPAVGSVSLSPRGDWSMPDDALMKAWSLALPQS